jgi:hypothetical protein
MKKIVLLLILIITIISAQARTFYFSSSTGNDTYTTTQAQNSLTPWRTLAKIQFYTISGRVLFQPGDTLAFKRGDVFANGNNAYVSVFWWNVPNSAANAGSPQYFTAPSGTANAPIVFTNYGNINLPLPNFLHPNATIPTTSDKNVFGFAGVSWIVIDGLQFNDTRFPVADKSNPAYTTSAMILGEYTQARITNGVLIPGSASDTNNRKRYVKNVVVKNCYFSNISYAFAGIAAENTKFINNTITNLKSTTDTAGTNDVMAGAFEGMNCDDCEVTNNYIKGAWAKSGRISSTYGLGGVAFDMFNCNRTKIMYNTIIDCSGAFEIGNIDDLDTTSGCKYVTFAYNKVINCAGMGYIHGSTGAFVGNNKNITILNNVVINNNSSRMNGPNFGADIYNDGQSFSQWWFFKDKYKCPSNSLPITDNTWSNPIHPSVCNYGGHRFAIQYASDNIRGNADTLIDSRNNIFYSTVGDQMVYDRTKYKRSNNIYYIKGRLVNNTTLGGTLRPGERIINTAIFRDTTAVHPEDWDLHLLDTSYGVLNGTPTGITKDFNGVDVVGNPSIGLYQYYFTVSIPPCSFRYGQWSTCTNGTQSRSFTSFPSGCQGTPPLDSIRRTCTNSVVISFYYNVSRKAIWINTTVPGTMRITNTLGNIARNINYAAGGQWISMNRYPSGVYFATTYGQNIIFIR